MGKHLYKYPPLRIYSPECFSIPPKMLLEHWKTFSATRIVPHVHIYYNMSQGGRGSQFPKKTSSLPPCCSCCQTDHATSATNYHIYWPDIPSHQHTGQHVSIGKYFILAPSFCCYLYQSPIQIKSGWCCSPTTSDYKRIHRQGNYLLC